MTCRGWNNKTSKTQTKQRKTISEKEGNMTINLATIINCEWMQSICSWAEQKITCNTRCGGILWTWQTKLLLSLIANNNIWGKKTLKIIILRFNLTIITFALLCLKWLVLHENSYYTLFARCLKFISPFLESHVFTHGRVSTSGSEHNISVLKIPFSSQAKSLSLSSSQEQPPLYTWVLHAYLLWLEQPHISRQIQQQLWMPVHSNSPNVKRNQALWLFL